MHKRQNNLLPRRKTKTVGRVISIIYNAPGFHMGIYSNFLAFGIPTYQGIGI